MPLPTTPQLPIVQTARTWNISVLTYTRSQRVDVVTNCFGFMFTNIGDTAVEVEGMVVFPSATPATALGDSRSISAHELDIYKGNIVISFRVPLGVNPLLEIVQLYYAEKEIVKRVI